MRERSFISSIVTTTKVNASATVVTLSADKSTWLGRAIFNDTSAANLKVKFGDAAAADDFAVELEPGAYYEVPFGYTGIITGIWASATGACRVSEFQ